MKILASVAASDPPIPRSGRQQITGRDPTPRKSGPPASSAPELPHRDRATAAPIHDGLLLTAARDCPSLRLPGLLPRGQLGGPRATLPRTTPSQTSLQRRGAAGAP